MENPHHPLKSRSAWSITLRWVLILVVLTLFAGAMLPLVMKPRKRSRATAILEEMRLIDAAKDQYSIENNLSGDQSLTWSEVKLYLKTGTRLYNQAAELDLFGSPIALDPTAAQPNPSDAADRFTDVIDDPKLFWGSFAN